MFTEHIPCIVNSNGSSYLDSTKIEAIEAFYSEYLNDFQKEFTISRDYSAAIYDFLKLDFNGCVGLKGHVTGPVSFGLHLNDENGKPTIYNDLLMDVTVKTLAGIIRWQERLLSEKGFEPLIFLDEPYMSLMGTTIVSLDQQRIKDMLNELISCSKNKIGIHCCANTDWSFLFETDVQVISFDAYEYSENFLLYREEFGKYFRRGGKIAWGLVPTAKEQINQESVESLFSKFEQLLSIIEDSTKISREQIIQSSLITPACGLGARDETTATAVFQMTRSLSDKIRQDYNLR